MPHERHQVAGSLGAARFATASHSLRLCHRPRMEPFQFGKVARAVSTHLGARARHSRPRDRRPVSLRGDSLDPSAEDTRERHRDILQAAPYARPTPDPSRARLHRNSWVPRFLSSGSQVRAPRARNHVDFLIDPVHRRTSSSLQDWIFFGGEHQSGRPTNPHAKRTRSPIHRNRRRHCRRASGADGQLWETAGGRRGHPGEIASPADSGSVCPQPATVVGACEHLLKGAGWRRGLSVAIVPQQTIAGGSIAAKPAATARLARTRPCVSGGHTPPIRRRRDRFRSG